VTTSERASAPAPEDIRVPGAGIELEALVLTHPDPAPLVMVLHGWGDDAATMLPLAEGLWAAGFAAASVSMRGWGGSGGGDDLGLEQPDDIVVAADDLASRPWVRDGRSGIVGVSQGGQVALLAAARGAAVRAVAAWAPVTDLDQWRATTEYPGIPDYIDFVAGSDTRPRSPVHVAADIAVPVLLVHGDADTRVPTAQSHLLADAMARAGRRPEVELLAGVGHGRHTDGNERALARTVEFLRSHL
jgi:dipeptidyl aminopeptidase/acylaminoacyl peptidase